MCRAKIESILVSGDSDIDISKVKRNNFVIVEMTKNNIAGD